MTTVSPPICLYCKHLRKDGLTCEAFPERIPQTILESEHDHRKPYNGDKGIRFDSTGAKGDRYVAEMFEEDDT